MSNLKRNIQRVLNERSITLAKLAQLSGVQQSTLHRIMASEVDEPRSSTLAPLAEFLGVSVHTLRQGDLPVQLTFHNSPIKTRQLHADIVEVTPAKTSGSESRTDLAMWDRDAQISAFEDYFLNSTAPERLHWRSEIDGFTYHLDYCSDRLAVELISFSRPAPASYPRAERLDLQALFQIASRHAFDLLTIRTAYPHLTPLLLILCPVMPDVEAQPVRRLFAAAHRHGFRVRFVTSGSAAVQAVLKAEADCEDEIEDDTNL